MNHKKGVAISGLHLYEPLGVLENLDKSLFATRQTTA